MHDLAFVMSYIVVPDRDEARRRAAILAEKSARALFRLGSPDYGVVASTNAAVFLMELSAPVATDLWSAHKVLEESFRWRKKKLLMLRTITSISVWRNDSSWKWEK